ncbi:hypothetical protein ACOMHN_022446 [Nucella lapillus]
MNWELCCLCQTDKTEEALQTPKEEGLVSLERDLKDFIAINANDLPHGINVTISQLNDGSGIAATLKSHKASYHKLCRSYCSSTRVKRAREKLDKEAGEQNSPKKLRSSVEIQPPANIKCCIICESVEQSNLHKVVTNVVDANLKRWAKTNKNFQLLGRLVTTASDAHAADAYYHHRCYVLLRDSAASAERSDFVGPAPPPFDTIICAQIIALIEHSDTTSFKLSELREMYQKLMSDQGHPCRDKKEPHSTRFKDHLLNFLPEWAEFSQGNKGRKDIYISHKLKVAHELARTYMSHNGQEDALIFMRAAVMMHKFCLQSQEPFDGSFPPNCLTASVNEEMRSFFNVVLRGPSALHGREKIGGDANLDAREKIACNISQLLIYNTSKGTHHAVKTAAVRHNKERETPFPLYHGLKLHGNGRDKKQIGIHHEQGISVSYNRVMEVKRCVARAVCARHAQDGVVLPTNSRFNIFTTHDVDNIDSKAQGNFSHCSSIEWGWHKDGTNTWQPLWTTLSDASLACAILLQCGCLKACTGRCKCNRAGVRCTVLCKCEGGCVNNGGDDHSSSSIGLRPTYLLRTLPLAAFSLRFNVEEEERRQIGWITCFNIPLGLLFAGISQYCVYNRRYSRQIRSLRPIDLVKMDIEHSEWLALDDMAETGQLLDIRQLCLEFHDTSRSADAIRKKLIVLEKLERQGFRRFFTHMNTGCGVQRKVYPDVRANCYEI